MTDAQHPRRDEMWALFRGDRLARELGMELEDWGPGWSRVVWTPGEEHHNFAGSVHGGALFTLADVAFAVACNSWGPQAVALSVDVHFLAAARAGVPLVATGRERSRTRRTGSYHLDVHERAAGRDDVHERAEDQRHVASLHAMAYRSRTWHLDEEGWPDAWRSLA